MEFTSFQDNKVIKEHIFLSARREVIPVPIENILTLNIDNAIRIQPL